MDGFIPLFIGLFSLIVIIWLGRCAILKFREYVHDEASEGVGAIHSMLANLQQSLERGEISEFEYRSVKSELMGRLQDFAGNKKD